MYLNFLTYDVFDVVLHQLYLDLLNLSTNTILLINRQVSQVHSSDNGIPTYKGKFRSQLYRYLIYYANR